MRLLPWLVSCVLLLSGRLPAAEPSAPLQRLAVVSIEDSMMEKAEKIIIPHLEFTDLTPAEALEFLRKKILERDPSGGVKFDARYESVDAGEPEGQLPVIPGLGDVSPTDADPPSITLSVTDIPVSDAIQYIAGLGGIEIEVVRGAAFLAKLKTRTFRFVFNEPDLCEELGIDETTAAKIRGDVKQYLENAGIIFHTGTECQVFAEGKRLLVKHTEEDLDTVQNELEELIPSPVPGPEVPKWTPEKPDPEVALRRRAEALVLNDVQFVGTPLAEAVQQLAELSALADVKDPKAKNRGVPFLVVDKQIARGKVMEPAVPKLSNQEVHYSARNISLLTVVEALAKQVGGIVSFRERGVLISTEVELNLVTRGYRIRSLEELMPPRPVDELERKTIPEDLSNSAAGVRFPSGSASIYLPSAGTLFLHASAESHAVIQGKVEKMWREYYASDEWLKEQKRQERLRELGIHPKSNAGLGESLNGVLLEDLFYSR